MTCSIVSRSDNRRTDDELILAKISEGHVKLTATIQLAREFAAIVREQQAAKLDGWLRQASHSGIRLWSNFRRGFVSGL